jgi:Leucine-rich repeat (LRR) protein
MPDSEILRKLEEKVGRPFPHSLDNGRCIELSLCDDAAIFHGLVRHHTPAAKLEILRLVSQLDGLRKLNLRRNRLGVLPVEFGRLKALEELTLSSNYLGCVPEPIRGLTRLKSLLLGNNDLVELPSWLGELSELEHLALHKNVKLKYIEPICGLKHLRTLNLYYVNLLELPAFIYEFRALSTLTLWNVKRFPDGLDPLVNLEFFTNCGTPGLRSLPKGFTRLRKLRMTRLAQNNLESLPEDMGELKNLEQISLYQNQLSRLPDSMSSLQRLCKLNLAWNRFETVPEWLNNIQSLQWLAIFENPLAQPETIRARSGMHIERQWPFSTAAAANGSRSKAEPAFNNPIPTEPQTITA